MVVWVFIVHLFLQVIAEKRILLDDPAFLQSQIHDLERKMEDVVARNTDLTAKYTDLSVKYNTLLTKSNGMCTHLVLHLL